MFFGSSCTYAGFCALHLYIYITTLIRPFLYRGFHISRPFNLLGIEHKWRNCTLQIHKRRGLDTQCRLWPHVLIRSYCIGSRSAGSNMDSPSPPRSKSTKGRVKKDQKVLKKSSTPSLTAIYGENQKFFNFKVKHKLNKIFSIRNFANLTM